MLRQTELDYARAASEVDWPALVVTASILVFCVIAALLFAGAMTREDKRRGRT